jgi:hypothetical protein
VPSVLSRESPERPTEDGSELADGGWYCIIVINDDHALSEQLCSQRSMEADEFSMFEPISEEPAAETLTWRDPRPVGKYAGAEVQNRRMPCVG